MHRPRRAELAALTLAAAMAISGTTAPAVEAVAGVPTGTSMRAATPPAPPAKLPKGWRWESYRNVQIGVPGDWTWGGVRSDGHWCFVGEKAPAPRVGRPHPGGAQRLTRCGHAKSSVHPSTQIDKTGMFVFFKRAEFEEPGTTGDRTTIEIGDVAVLIQAEQKLRDRIIDTLHTIEVDAGGCPVRDQVTAKPGRKPAPAIKLKKLTGVRSVAACVYELNEGTRTIDGPSLVSSVRLTGKTAAKSLAALATSPKAGGQDRPTHCSYGYGSEMLVLLIESATGTSRVHVRFSGCDHNAVDDGISPRRLTPALLPFFSGGNRPESISGGPGKFEATFGPVRHGKVSPPKPPPA